MKLLVTLAASFLFVGCASVTDRMVSFSVSVDEMKVAAKQETEDMPYEKILFNQFCKNGQQIRPFVVKGKWPLGKCTGMTIDRAERAYTDFYNQMDQEAVEAINRVIAWNASIPFVDDDFVEKNDTFFNKQCKPGASLVIDKNKNIYFSSGTYKVEFDKDTSIVLNEILLFKHYAVLPDADANYKYTRRVDGAIDYEANERVLNVSPVEFAASRDGILKYLRQHYKIEKEITDRIAFYEISYDMNDFCEHAKLKEDLIAK